MSHEVIMRQTAEGFARRSTREELEAQGWIVGYENSPFFGIHAVKQTDGCEYDHSETGTAIGVIPIYRDADGRLHLTLIQEFKQVLNRTRLFMASDYVKDRPAGFDTGHQILVEKTGLCAGIFRVLMTRPPAYEPNQQQNITILVAIGCARTGEGTAEVVDLTLKEAERMLRGKAIDCGTTWQAIGLLSNLERNGELTA